MNQKFKKVVSATSKNIAFNEKKISADARIQQILRELGVNTGTYNTQASFRKYSRMAKNPHIGIGMTIGNN